MSSKKKFDRLADELASYLRKQDINVAVDYTNRKIPAQIKTAEKLGIPYIICIGDEEVKSKMFKLKNLGTRDEKMVNREALVGFIQMR